MGLSKKNLNFNTFVLFSFTINSGIVYFFDRLFNRVHGSVKYVPDMRFSFDWIGGNKAHFDVSILVLINLCKKKNGVHVIINYSSSLSAGILSLLDIGQGFLQYPVLRASWFKLIMYCNYTLLQYIINFTMHLMEKKRSNLKTKVRTLRTFTSFRMNKYSALVKL